MIPSDAERDESFEQDSLHVLGKVKHILWRVLATRVDEVPFDIFPFPLQTRHADCFRRRPDGQIILDIEMMAQVGGDEIDAAKVGQFVSDRLFQWDWIEEEDATIVQNYRGRPEAHGDEFAEAQGREAVERCGESGDCRRDVSHRSGRGGHLCSNSRGMDQVISIRRRAMTKCSRLASQ